jgi:uncharacterized protein (TIGR03435 family)
MCATDKWAPFLIGAILYGVSSLRIAAAPDGPITQPAPIFEVASVRPSGSSRFFVPEGSIGFGRRVVPVVYSDTRFSCDMSLGAIVEEAYGVKKMQIAGPEWLYDDTFAIAATMPAGTSRDATRLMLRALLAERFGLQLRHEKRKLPIYALVVAKGGPKLQRVDDPGKAEKVNVSLPGAQFKASMFFSAGQFSASAITVELLASNLTLRADRPVVDRTGLEGTYKIDVRWEPSDTRSLKDPAFLPALQQQLGLRLEKREALYDILVIDHVSRKPTEN